MNTMREGDVGNNGSGLERVATMCATRREMLALVRGRYTVEEVVQDEPYTYVRVRFKDADGMIFEGVGFAKQNRYGQHADKWNTNTGRALAVGRAIRKLLNNLEACRDMWPAYALTV
jgi:hypothetical protein